MVLEEDALAFRFVGAEGTVVQLVDVLRISIPLDLG
jgi:hypothetical protein